MIRIREQNKFKLSPPYYSNKFLKIEENNRYITAEFEKKHTIQNLYLLSKNTKQLIHDLNKNSAKTFSLISIETSSKCNLDCSFCPVNKEKDPRPPGLLPMELIEKIAYELSEINYSSAILPFGNNEPLLDIRIFDIITLFREKCPKSYIKLLTNGTLLTVEKTVKLFEHGLSTLTINNYSSSYKLIRPVEEIISNSKKFKCYDLRISLRNNNENLTNRA